MVRHTHLHMVHILYLQYVVQLSFEAPNMHTHTHTLKRYVHTHTYMYTGSWWTFHRLYPASRKQKYIMNKFGQQPYSSLSLANLSHPIILPLPHPQLASICTYMYMYMYMYWTG